MRRFLRLLFRTPKGFAQGGQIPSSQKHGDDIPVFLSEGHVWRVIDVKLRRL